MQYDTELSTHCLLNVVERNRALLAELCVSVPLGHRELDAVLRQQRENADALAMLGEAGREVIK